MGVRADLSGYPSNNGEMMRRQTSEPAMKAEEWLRGVRVPSNLHPHRPLSISKCFPGRDPPRARCSVIAVSGVLEKALKFA